MEGQMGDCTFHAPEKVLIFPSTRNLAKLQRIALAAAASKNPENTIRAALDRSRASQKSRGLPPQLIRKDNAELETALRALVVTLQVIGGLAR
jgi:hypothetical protein